MLRTSDWIGKRDFDEKFSQDDFTLFIFSLGLEVLLKSPLDICISNQISSHEKELALDCLKLVDFSQGVSKVGTVFKLNHMNFDPFVRLLFKEIVNLTSVEAGTNEDLIHFIH